MIKSTLAYIVILLGCSMAFFPPSAEVSEADAIIGEWTNAEKDARYHHDENQKEPGKPQIIT